MSGIARMEDLLGPVSRFFVSQRLRLHYVDWGNHGAPTLVLVHGGRDHARSWDWVARDLRRDWHVVAPDLRGHGDSAWAVGSLYHMVEYVIDLAQLLQAIGRFPVTLVAHSLGSSICAHYAAAHPEHVASLVAIEGIEPPPRIRKWLEAMTAVERLRGAIEEAQQQAARSPRRYATLADAARRMQEENAFLSPEQARHLTEHGVARNEDGTFSWKFDNYARGPKLFRPADDEQREIRRSVRCPVLMIRGTASGVPDPAASGVLADFPNARAAAVEGAGHWVHHDRLDETLRLVREFLAER
jgi:pimeloyl-ACP methyl ester carboxylesterase